MAKLFATSGLIINGLSAPAALAANQNDWAPADFAECYEVAVDLTADRTVTGLAGGLLGRKVRFFNVSAFVLSITNQDAASAAQNRINTPGGQTLRVPAGGWVDLYYTGAGVNGRWRVLDMSVPRDLQISRRIAAGSVAVANAGQQLLGPFTRLAGERLSFLAWPVENNATIQWAWGNNVVANAVYLSMFRTANPNEFRGSIINTSGVDPVNVEYLIEGVMPAP